MPWAVAGAAVAAAGSIGGGIMSSNAAGAASKAQQQAANEATQLQQSIYKQNQQNLSGYQASGTIANDALDTLYGLNPMTMQWGTQDSASAPGQALTTLEGLSGIHPTGSNINSSQAFNNAYSAFQNSPTYQFALQQGQQTLDRSAASKGLLLSGAQLKDSQAYGQGLASQGLSQFTSNLTNLYNGLVSGITGLSQLGQNSAVQQGAQGLTSAGQIGGSLTNAGIAQASGALGQNNAMNTGLQNALGSLGGNNSSFGANNNNQGGLGDNLSYAWNNAFNLNNPVGNSASQTSGAGNIDYSGGNYNAEAGF